MRRAFAVFLAAAISTAACAGDMLPYPDEKWPAPPPRPPSIAWEKLPKEVSDTVAEVRGSCKEYSVEDYEEPRNRWQGVSFITLDGKDRVIAVDHEWLCNQHIAGANCSNRGCNLDIYKEVSPGQWRKIFDEHLYEKHFALDWETYRLQLMLVAISASDSRCRRDPKEITSTRMSCNLIVTYRNGKWIWQKIK